MSVAETKCSWQRFAVQPKVPLTRLGHIVPTFPRLSPYPLSLPLPLRQPRDLRILPASLHQAHRLPRPHWPLLAIRRPPLRLRRPPRRPTLLPLPVQANSPGRWRRSKGYESKPTKPPIDAKSLLYMPIPTRPTTILLHLTDSNLALPQRTRSHQRLKRPLLPLRPIDLEWDRSLQPLLPIGNTTAP